MIIKKEIAVIDEHELQNPDIVIITVPTTINMKPNICV
jgi:hypothetical protein